MSNKKLNGNTGNPKDEPDDQAGPAPAFVAEEPDEWFDVDSLYEGGVRPKNKAGLQRRQGRGVALQTLFEGDAVKHDPLQVLDRHIHNNGLSTETAEFARMLVRGVIQNRSRLDDLISASAPNWPVDQMAKVDKNILRLAIFEILFNNDVPTKAAINEAIELAKNFGSDSSSRFVNGVLGAIVTQNPRNENEQQPA